MICDALPPPAYVAARDTLPSQEQRPPIMASRVYAAVKSTKSGVLVLKSGQIILFEAYVQPNTCFEIINRIFSERTYQAYFFNESKKPSSVRLSFGFD